MSVRISVTKCMVRLLQPDMGTILVLKMVIWAWSSRSPKDGDLAHLCLYARIKLLSTGITSRAAERKKVFYGIGTISLPIWKKKFINQIWLWVLPEPRRFTSRFLPTINVQTAVHSPKIGAGPTKIPGLGTPLSILFCRTLSTAQWESHNFGNELIWFFRNYWDLAKKIAV